jgi:hypothetical protein
MIFSMISLFCGAQFRYLRLMRASVSSTREPMKPESRRSGEQGLVSAVIWRQELQRYDPLDVRLQPCVRDELAGPAPYRLPDNLLFPARSTKYLLRVYPERCAPNRGNSLRALAKVQNCDVNLMQRLPKQTGMAAADNG